MAILRPHATPTRVRSDARRPGTGHRPPLLDVWRPPAPRASFAEWPLSEFTRTPSTDGDGADRPPAACP